MKELPVSTWCGKVWPKMELSPRKNRFPSAAHLYGNMNVGAGNYAEIPALTGAAGRPIVDKTGLDGVMAFW